MSLGRVLHTNFLHGWGGQSNRILTECEGLAALGWDVLTSAPGDSVLLARSREKGLQVNDSVQYVGGLKRGWMKDIIAMRQVLRDFRPDMVHLHGGKDSWVLAQALAVSPPISRPIIIRTKHNVFPIKDHIMNRWQYGRFFNSIIGLSTAIIEQLEEKPYIENSKLTRIPSAIDASRFEVGAQARDRIRTEFAFEDHHLVVGMTGRLRSEKGHDILIRAVPEIVGEFPDARFIFFGAGSLKHELADQLAAAGCTDKVIMTGFRTDVPECLSALDAYAQPSRSEGLGTSLLEASAAGIAIVATRTGGIPDVVVDGETGLLVEPESPEDMAQGVRTLLRDADLRQRLAGAARQRVKTVFSVETLVKSTHELYQALMAGRRSQG